MLSRSLTAPSAAPAYPWWGSRRAEGRFVDGKLEVLDHPSALVGDLLVAAWIEVRGVGRHVEPKRE